MERRAGEGRGVEEVDHVLRSRWISGEHASVFMLWLEWLLDRLALWVCLPSIDAMKLSSEMLVKSCFLATGMIVISPAVSVGGSYLLVNQWYLSVKHRPPRARVCSLIQ